jgi:hypothetical protein
MPDITLTGDLDLPCVTPQIALRITYSYEPGSGPLYARGEPLPIGPAEPPEVEIEQVEISAARTEITCTRDANKRLRVDRSETIWSNWQPMPKALLDAMFSSADWRAIREHIAEEHQQEC